MLLTWVAAYSNTTGSPSANSALTMITETKPIERKAPKAAGTLGVVARSVVHPEMSDLQNSVLSGAGVDGPGEVIDFVALLIAMRCGGSPDACSRDVAGPALQVEGAAEQKRGSSSV